LSAPLIPAVAEGPEDTGANALEAALAATLAAAFDFVFAAGFLALGLDFAAGFEGEGPFEEGLDATGVFSF
jgi:hypothetical protein